MKKLDVSKIGWSNKEENEKRQWAEYWKAMERCKLKHQDNPTSMAAAMTEPNKPGYFRANND